MLTGRRLFSEKGIYESRVEDITKHAGIAKGTLYLYFRSKEELVGAVVASGFVELQRFVAARLRGQRSLRGTAAALFAGHVAFFDQNPDLMRILHQARGALKFDRPLWRPLRTQLRMHVEFLAQRLTLRETRSWSAASRRELAVFLFGCASGTTSVLVSTYPKSADLRDWSDCWSEPVGRAVVAASAARTR